MKKCAKCDHELIEGLKYCFNCGEEVDTNDEHNSESDNKKCQPKTRLDSQVLDVFFN